MFGFMKSKAEKERKKQEKKDRKQREKEAMSNEDLDRLEQVKKGVFGRRFSGDSGKHKQVSGNNHNHHLATPYPEPNSDNSSNTSSERPSPAREDDGHVYTSETQIQLNANGGDNQMNSRPARGILKGKSSYGPEIPNQGVRGNVDDSETLEQNTMANEVLAAELLERQNQAAGDSGVYVPELKGVKNTVADFERSAKDNPGNATYENVGSISRRTPVNSSFNSPSKRIQREEVISPPSPSEKTFGDIDLKLPNLAPPRCPRPREIELKRSPAGDFGFTLRRGTVLERGLEDDNERKRMVIFAEPGPRTNQTGLLPGDRLIEVNGTNVENSTREEIIELIRHSGDSVMLKVQPIPELSELSMRSGLDGGEIHVQEQAVKSGTLQRSGSMRYKSKAARSEDHVATEKAWLSAERVWLVHKGGFAGAKLLKKSEKGVEVPEGKCKVKLDHGGEVLEVDEEDVEKANPPQFDRVEDLATLRYLNESSILHSLRQRYGSNLIHTYGGQSLLTVNPMHPMSIYSEKVIQMFKGCKQEDMPPHIYATAQIAYRTMLATRHDQAVVMMGRSGSGKTTNTKHILTYLTTAAGSVGNVLTVEKLNGLFTLIDAFGNSRTIMNTSASRVTQMYSLDFDHTGQIAAASVQVLMLEKNRVCRRPEGEPTFHVFYHMLAGIDSQLRNEFQLQNLSEPNLFMTPLQRNEDRQRATQAWAKIHHAMGVLGITDDECKAIYATLAAIYHLGVAGTVKGATSKYQFARPAAAQRAAQVLGTTVEELSRAIFSPPQQVQPRGSFRGTPEKQGPGETVTGMEALEGFAVGLYSEAFNALISLINRSLSSNYRTISSIMILDTPGFQNPATCGRKSGATFEDLCQNYTQERLQLLFHDMVFTQQQDLYSQENVECDFEMVTSTPMPMVTFIDKPPTQAIVRSGGKDDDDSDKKGLLWILDEQAIFPGATEDNFLEKLAKQYAHSIGKKDSVLKKGTQRGCFVLNHFQGTNPVQYNTKGWLKSCRENPVSRVVGPMLQDSHRQEISSLFSNVRGPVSHTVSGSVVGIEGTSSLRRASSMRRAFTTGQAGVKRRSICLQVKFQVDSVIETLRRSKVHFAHCLLPQHNGGLCDLRAAQISGNKSSDDIVMNVPLVRAQIRGAEITEAVRIHRQGFPEHMLFADFRHRFDLLVPADVKPSGPVVDEKKAVEQMLEHLEIEKSTYRLGLSQVFFRAGGLAQLEDSRDEKITGFIVSLQSYCRGYLGREMLKKLKLQHLAVSCIQRNVKKFMAIRDWPWWRLYTKVQPLLNVHKTEEELKDKEVELEQLKMRLEKLEKERNDYKQGYERLDNKLTEVTADLSEEHTTSNHATEMLESETAERMRLEKECKDLQMKFTSLQRKQEQTELDLMQTRMLAATLEEFDEDDVDGADSVYRERYERSKREFDFIKKRMQQEHVEALEQEKVMIKKSERKLADAVVENEESQKQVSNLKKKCQRLNAEMQDMKLHLEEQVVRNSELEKKQRKFDSELHKVNEYLKEEKNQREKIQRERDQYSSEKFKMDQQLKNVTMDFELEVEKVQRLQSELNELSTVGKDDKDLMQYKRAKHELTAKLEEQEEELDEQAGTIQQLEQTKLRLEMAQEKLRQQHAKELEEKEQELEDMRGTTQKRVKALEVQIEEEYEERQNAIKEKRELERKLQAASEVTPTRNREVEKRLRRDLRRTKALLEDAQVMLDKQKEGVGSRTGVRQLRNQLDDAEYATAAAVKARKGIEMEVQELQQQLDDISKAKQDADERCMKLTREKNDLQNKVDDNEEDTNELMKKYNNCVKQRSADLITMQDQSNQIEELIKEKQQLTEQVTELTMRIEFLQNSTVDKEVTTRLEAKIRDLESRLEYEEAAKSKAEKQSVKYRDLSESVALEKDRLNDSEQKNHEVNKRLQRQLRDLKEELGDVQRKEAEASQRKHDLENKVETLESDYEQSQSDLRLAFKRIADLQATIEDDMESDDSELDEDDYSDGEDSEDSEDYSSYLLSHRTTPMNRSFKSNASDTPPRQESLTSLEDFNKMNDVSEC